MKRKGFLLVGMTLAFTMATMAQKFALIDSEYILKNIPAYEMINEQLSQLSKKWQSEIDALQEEAQNMFKSFQSDLVFLSVDMKSKREEAIVEKDREAMELKRKYFGADGELYQKRASLMNPIQDEIYNAIREMGYDLVLDRASAMSVIYANPRIDISDEVLVKLGYSR